MPWRCRGVRVRCTPRAAGKGPGVTLGASGRCCPSSREGSRLSHLERGQLVMWIGAQHRPASWCSLCLAGQAAKGRLGHGTAAAGAAATAAARSLAWVAAGGAGARAAARVRGGNGRAQLSPGAHRAGDVVPPPALCLVVPVASGPLPWCCATLCHSHSPPQGTAQEPAAERPDGSGSSRTSGTTWPWEKECLAWSVFAYFFLPEPKEVFVGITKSQNARAYLSTTQPPPLPVTDKDAPDVAEELVQSLLLQIRLLQDG